MKIKFFALFFTVLFIISCGDDSKPSIEISGIYEITSYKNGEKVCQDESQDDLSSLTDKYIYGIKSSFFGYTFLTIYSCLSIDQCKSDKAAKIERSKSQEINFGPSQNELNFSFQILGENDASGEITTTSLLSSDPLKCSGTFAKSSLKKLGEKLEITKESVNVNFSKLNAEGFCDVDEAKKIAQQNGSCSSKTILEAKLNNN